LCGPGGIGKTRLALRLLAVVAAEFPDGAWFIELADLQQPDLVISRIAAVLGVSEEPGRSLLETLADVLRGRRLVLALDNCEHLVDACAEVARHLLASSPGLRLVVTSREPLRVAAETVWRRAWLTPGSQPGSSSRCAITWCVSRNEGGEWLDAFLEPGRPASAPRIRGAALVARAQLALASDPAAAEALPERAVQLAAAAAAVRESAGVPPLPPARTETYLAPARHLGEAAVARLWAQGLALSSEAAVTLAVDARPSKAADSDVRALTVAAEPEATLPSRSPAGRLPSGCRNPVIQSDLG
jgi:AAA domain